MDSSPKSAHTALMVMRHRDMPEPLDFTAPALDLCVRGRKRSPSPEGAKFNTKREPIYIEPPTSTFCFSSPGSQVDSETSDMSSTSDLVKEYGHYSSDLLQQKAKIPRPFKAYPKDPLSLAVGVATAEAILGQDSAEAYGEFRKRMLSQVQSSNVGTNKNMRRNTQKDVATSIDPTYWEKRRKNNEAAKRSRDARRAKEDEIAIRCAYLEQENLKLRYEVAALRNESERLRNLVYH